MTVAIRTPGEVIKDTKITITAESKYKNTRFINVLFIVTEPMQAFAGKRVFDQCQFINTHGLPSWVSFISR